MLALLVLVVIAALWGAGHLVSLESEDDTIDALREAIVRDTNGDISVRDTLALAKRRQQAPNFWFVIGDREEHTVSERQVPGNMQMAPPSMVSARRGSAGTSLTGCVPLRG